MGLATTTENGMDSNYSFQIPPSPDSHSARQHHYARRAAEADERHRFWQMLWYELARDYNASMAYVVGLVHALDAHHETQSHKHH